MKISLLVLKWTNDVGGPIFDNPVAPSLPQHAIILFTKVYQRLDDTICNVKGKG